ncbi:MAG TPA: RsmE family RNA methyltransferase [Kofleriaceae bacterium]|nr:RsmE family RNA methyltransferase [Kofleriaceae bacterium]
MLRLLIDPPELVPGERTVRGDDHHYLFHVRRMRPGDRLILFDGEGCEAEAEVKSVASRTALLEVGARVMVAPARGVPRLTVILSLIKGERMDHCLTKLVEIGVGRIVPLRAERSVVRLEDERAERRRERFRAQVRAAVQQCRAMQVPVVDSICGLDQALALTAQADLKLVFWEGAKAVPLRSVLPPEPPATVAMLVGPEGGLSAGEVEAAGRAGFVAVGLGPRILRADTAAIAGAAILAYTLGDI